VEYLHLRVVFSHNSPSSLGVLLAEEGLALFPFEKFSKLNKSEYSGFLKDRLIVGILFCSTNDADGLFLLKYNLR
jgi:hypothetical protein